VYTKVTYLNNYRNMNNSTKITLANMENQFTLCNEFVRKMDIAIANDNYDGRTWKYII